MYRNKQIIFDIDTKVAKAILGNSYNNIYSKIRKYFKDNGFIHIEGSGYVSNKDYNFDDVLNIITSLVETYPFLEKCFRDMRLSEEPEIHSLNFMFDYDGTPGKYAQDENTEQVEADYYDEFEM
ncbi:MAG: hypothetical protein IJ054_06445 [Lachnospiraceae bacterium]|nr:hypothetical protein [Lachnospiraceae bacterium]